MSSKVSEQQVKYLSITQLNHLLQSALEDLVPTLSFRGEISEISRPQSGHLYFTLKDENAQISAVMWKGQAALVAFPIKSGIEVLCHGKPTIYQKAGRLQVVVHRMLPAGEGLLQQRFFQLKKKLGAEGLFSPERKKSLPFLPKAIGVVTSGSGAVIHDIMVKIRERMPALKVYLVDVHVQGDVAAEEIADAVKLLNECGLVEVIIVARGGGSLEDLWAFNEEIVVRAIAASKIPVISGVGHEIDISLSDLAADMRAATPTAAAEIVVPKRDELKAQIEGLAGRLRDAERWLQPKSQALDEAAMRLDRALAAFLDAKRLQREKALLHLKSIEPQRLIATLKERLARWAERLDSANIRLTEQMGNRVQFAAQKLEALSPKRVLERGFAVVQSREGILTSYEGIQRGELLTVLLAQGGIEASVEKICENWEEIKKR